ncbi:uncharacterized protein [Miscanthus floridulus]|uniref:uncharacterized protein n=1 Tax=Miscanthus floridulus TaxID=154761 RepID=UPI003458EE54
MVMRLGQGKKHGRYWIGDGTLEPSEIPSLSQIRAQTPSGGPAIRQRPSPSQQRVNALQAKNERMARELRDLAARTEQVERERQDERAERERQAKQLAEITTFLQNFGQMHGVAVPQFGPPSPPVRASPPPSAGSNNPSQAQAGDGTFPSPSTQFPPHQ